MWVGAEEREVLVDDHRCDVSDYGGDQALTFGCFTRPEISYHYPGQRSNRSYLIERGGGKPCRLRNCSQAGL